MPSSRGGVRRSTSSSCRTSPRTAGPPGPATSSGRRKSKETPMPLDLQPPKTQIQQRLVTRVECRLSVLTEVMTHMGASEDTIRIAQAGFADGTMNRVIIRGLDAYEY